jgi:hypothetical protein
MSIILTYQFGIDDRENRKSVLRNQAKLPKILFDPAGLILDHVL